MLRPTRVVFAVLLLAAFTARGQATRPVAEQPWPKTMAAFAKALTNGDIEGMGKVLAPRASIHRFDDNHDEESWQLFDRVGVKATLVGHHAYMHPPMVMAADVSADFKTAAAVPDKAKAKFLIDDETEMKRANATAAQWVGEMVSAKHGAPVGVMILWTPKPSAAGGASSEPVYDVLFILCKGEQVAGNKYRISTVVYGGPGQE